MSVPQFLSPGLGTDPREELQKTLKPAPDSGMASSTQPSQRPGSTRNGVWDRPRGPDAPNLREEGAAGPVRWAQGL